MNATYITTILCCRVLWVPETEVKRCERKLQKRFSSVKTFPSTRKHHCYIPEEGAMKMKITSFSEDDSINVKLNLS